MSWGKNTFPGLELIKGFYRQIGKGKDKGDTRDVGVRQAGFRADN